MLFLLLLLLFFTFYQKFSLKNAGAVPEYQYLVLPSNFDLPHAKLIAIGSATHGSAQPFEATLQVLQFLYKANNDVAFLLEENVSDVIKVSRVHSFYDKETNQHIGAANIYDNQEMSKILTWIENNKICFCGIDIQSVSGIEDILYEKLKTIDFPRVEEIQQILRLKPKKNSKLDIKKIKLLDEMELFLYQMVQQSIIFEMDYAYFSFLINNVRMNNDYIQGGSLDAVRDKMMAENVSWIIKFEEKYYRNHFSLLFAHSGHIVKTKYSLPAIPNSEEVPMGSYLADEFGVDYYTIITEAENIAFSAQSRQNVNSRRTFVIQRKANLYNLFPYQNSNITFLTSKDLAERGIVQLDITGVGWYFTNALVSQLQYCTIPTSTIYSYNSILLWRNFTPSIDN